MIIYLIFLSFRYSVFRKPRPGTWEYLEKYKNSGIPIDRSRSFYCGDAAGQCFFNLSTNWIFCLNRSFVRSISLPNYCLIFPGRNRKPKGKKDFSCSDRLFAANVGGVSGISFF